MATDTTASLTALIKSLIKKQLGGFSSHVQGTFVAADAGDPLLSTITIYGKTCTRVRKLASVGVLTAGQQLLCIQGGGAGLIIIGVITGTVY